MTSAFVAGVPLVVWKQGGVRGKCALRRPLTRAADRRRGMYASLHEPVQVDADEEAPLLKHKAAPESASKPASPPPPGLVERTTPLDARVLLGEFLSTFLFVYLSVYSSTPLPGTPPGALLNGAVIAAIACSFMPVSGAHLNPAVTAALLVTRRVSLRRAIAFVPIQLVASAIASYCVKALGVPVVFAGVPAGVSLLKALADEVFPMALIVFVVFQLAVATPDEGGIGGPLAALYIGLAVLACAGSFATGVFNPARAFGPALVTGNFAMHWVYWVGPMIGALLAALMSEHLFLAPVSGRNPKSWLFVLMKRMDGMSNKVKSLGVAGMLLYCVFNCILYPSVMLTVLCMGGSWSAGAIGRAWLTAWAVSNATKPLRLFAVVALAPTVDRLLSKRRHSS